MFNPTNGIESYDPYNNTSPPSDPQESVEFRSLTMSYSKQHRQPPIALSSIPTGNQLPGASPTHYPLIPPLTNVFSSHPVPYPNYTPSSHPVPQPAYISFSSSPAQQLYKALNAIDAIQEIFKEGNKSFYSSSSIDYEIFINHIKKLETDYSSGKKIEYCTAFARALNKFIKNNQETFVNPHHILATLALIMIDPRDVRNPLDCLNDCDIDKLLQGAIAPEPKTHKEARQKQIKTCREIIEMLEYIIALSEKTDKPLNEQEKQTLNHLREGLQKIYRQELNRSIRKQNPDEKNPHAFLEERAAKITSLNNPEHAFEVLNSIEQYRSNICILKQKWVQDLNLFKTISESENEDYKKAVSYMIPAFQSRIRYAGQISDPETELLMTYLDQWKLEFPLLEGSKTLGTSRKQLSIKLRQLKERTGESSSKAAPSSRKEILRIVCDKGNAENPLSILEEFPDNQLTYIFKGLEKEKIKYLNEIIDKVDHLINKGELFLTPEHQDLYKQTVLEIEESHSAGNKIYHSNQKQQVLCSNQTDSLLHTPSLSFDPRSLLPNAFFESSSSQPQNKEQPPRKKPKKMPTETIDEL